MLVTPRRITVRRWWRISSAPYTVLRNLEYEAIRGLHLIGKVLDVGGGKNTSYNKLIKIDGSLESINIDPEIEPTIIADLNEPFPIDTGTYDHIISFNTYEHILNDELALRESIRVLKPGGLVNIIVPFIYKVHGSPYDFHRHPAGWWEQKLVEAGISPATIRIEPLGWVPLSVSFPSSFLPSRLHFRFPGFLLRRLKMFWGVILHARWIGQDRVPSGKQGMLSEHPLGYYITGQKK